MNIPDGKYAFRFDGYALGNTILHRLVGVGVMNLQGGVLTGEHRSTLCRLSGQDAAVEHSVYNLNGTYSGASDFGSATITFAEPQTAQTPQTVVGKFVFTPSGQDRFWLVSESGHVPTSGGALADEIVSGELVRIG